MLLTKYTGILQVVNMSTTVNTKEQGEEGAKDGV